MALVEAIEASLRKRVDLLGARLDTRKSIYNRVRIDDQGQPVTRELEDQRGKQRIRRGRGAFEIDLLVWEESKERIVPRVAIEVKERLTTDNIFTANTKAEMHKQCYPYLRYGLVYIPPEASIAPRHLLYSQWFDFIVAVSANSLPILQEQMDRLGEIVARPVGISRYLGRYLFHPPREATKSWALEKQWIFSELLAEDSHQKDNAFEMAVSFFEQHREELLTDYEGKFIAIIDNSVVDSDVDGVALAMRVYEKHGYKAMYMPKVEREPRTFRLPSPRLLKR